MSRFRLGFFGDGPWAVDALARIVADSQFDIAFVCGRASRLDEELRDAAAALGIEFLTVRNVNSAEEVARIAAAGCSLLISMSYDQIFRTAVRQVAPLGVINCHAGKLPFYRGRNVLTWVLVNDEKEFGITVHHVDDNIDTGDIILQQTYDISDVDDYSTLLARSASECGGLLYDGICRLVAGTAARIPQATIHPHGFYCSRRRPGDERLDWNQPSRRVFNWVRSVCRPGPMSVTAIDGNEVRVNRVEWLPEAPSYLGAPGSVLYVDREGVLVKTADSFVRVTEWSGVERIRVGDRFT